MSYAHALSLCLVIQRNIGRNSFWLLPQGYSERKTINLKNKTSVLLLIYAVNSEHW